MPGEIVFETHALTVDNESGVATGWGDSHLSERGLLLAAELGRRRRHDGVRVVFCSDLGRAVRTAEIAFAGAGIPVYTDWRLRECNYGDLNGMPVARLNAERPSRVRVPFPKGESYQDVVDRVADFLADLARHWNEHRVVVVGHSATRWALDHLVNGVPLAKVIEAPFDWQEGWVYRLHGGLR